MTPYRWVLRRKITVVRHAATRRRTRFEEIFTEDHGGANRSDTPSTRCKEIFDGEAAPVLSEVLAGAAFRVIGRVTGAPGHHRNSAGSGRERRPPGAHLLQLHPGRHLLRDQRGL